MKKMVWVIFVLLRATASWGSEEQAAMSLTGMTTAGECAGGVKLDDGSFETAYRIPFASSAQFVQKLTPSSYPALLKTVCSCWATNGTHLSVGYSVVVYDDDGPAGQPGTRLGTLSATASGLTFAGTFNAQECTPLEIVVESGSVYVGVDWNSAGTLGTFVCVDQSPTTPRANMFESASAGSTWSQVNATARALGIRAEFESNSTGCVPSPTSLCLNQGRFEVTARFKTNTQEGNANIVKLTDETGYLWFFNSSNVEAVVKVLNACALNGKYWVFAGGLTDVQVDLTVTDTATGNFKTYQNSQGKPFQPIQDTAALPCN